MSTKKRATKLKVMHHLDKDKDGNSTIHSIVSNPPKLKEAIDGQQVAEESGHKLPALPPAPRVQKGTAKPKREPKAKDELTELDHKILVALDKLGGEL